MDEYKMFVNVGHAPLWAIFSIFIIVINRKINNDFNIKNVDIKNSTLVFDQTI